MLHRMQRLVAPPIFEGDEEKTSAARLLNTALLTLAAFISGGVRAPAFSGSIVVVLGAGILVGRRAAIGVAVLSIAAGLAMLYAAQAGALPTSSAVYTDMAFWAAHTTYLIVAAVFLSLMIRSIHTALERARHELAERKQAEAALRASEERYRQISELVSDYAFAYRTLADGTAALEWVTDAMTRITGFTAEEMSTSAAWEAATHPDDLPIALRRRQRLQAGQSDMSEYRVITKDGQIRWLRFYSRPVQGAAQGQVLGVYGAVQDITTIKHLEQQLSQAQKLEAVGRLAGGVAHDFNNMLTVILGSCTLVLDRIDHEHALRYDIEQIQAAARRAAVLTRQLLAFSSRQVLQPTILDLNEAVIGTTQLLRLLIGEDIQLVMRLAPGLGMVKADAGQIDQVMVNLAINARDAMPHGGALTIETANVYLDEADARAHADVAAGPYIMLAMSDTGYGMDGATMARIFEPFFTTKAPDKGTGLGLATVHGIVRQSEGYIQVSSEPGQGTCFKVYLPRVAEPAAPGVDPQRADERMALFHQPHSPYQRAEE